MKGRPIRAASARITSRPMPAPTTGALRIDETARQHEGRRIHDLAHLRFGEKLREPFPGGFVRLDAVASDHPGEPRRRGGLGLFAPVGRLHQIGALRQLPENAMNIRHAGEPFVHQGRPLTGEGHKLRARHQESAGKAGIDELAMDEALRVGRAKIRRAAPPRPG